MIIFICENPHDPRHQRSLEQLIYSESFIRYRLFQKDSTLSTEEAVYSRMRLLESFLQLKYLMKQLLY